MTFKSTNSHVLIAIGLLGIAGYQIVLRLLHPPILSNDFVHGIWLGLCIGLECLGLLFLRKSKGGHAA